MVMGLVMAHPADQHGAPEAMNIDPDSQAVPRLGKSRVGRHQQPRPHIRAAREAQIDAM
jgi:hypothetical protein